MLMTISSHSKIMEKIVNEPMIRNVLTTIPNRIENKIRFFLYSFLSGLKYVAKRPGSENSLRE